MWTVEELTITDQVDPLFPLPAASSQQKEHYYYTKSYTKEDTWWGKKQDAVMWAECQRSDGGSLWREAGFFMLKLISKCSATARKVKITLTIKWDLLLWKYPRWCGDNSVISVRSTLFSLSLTFSFNCVLFTHLCTNTTLIINLTWVSAPDASCSIKI